MTTLRRPTAVTRVGAALSLAACLVGCAPTRTLPAGSARGAPAAGLELVYTFPAETSLVNRDLRPPRVVWLQLFRSAKNTIDLEEMYVNSEPGEPLDGVIDALEEAGRRGVRIRVMIEKKLLRASSAATIEHLRRIPHLTLKVVDWSKVIGKDGIIHAKFFVVDGEHGYLGSQNFDWRSLRHVQELGVRVGEPALARQMAAIFDHDWENAGLIEAQKPPQPFAPGPDPDPVPELARRARLVASPAEHNPPGVAASEAELLKLLGAAREEIRAQVMSYSATGHHKEPYHVIDDALRAAAARGVKVRLTVADWSTGHPAIDDLKSLAKVANVEVRIVTLPQFSQGFIPFGRVIHAKYCVIDGKVGWVGTSNWEDGYLSRSRNLELILRDAPLAARLRTLHEQLWTSEYAQPIEQDKDYPKVRRD